MLKLILLMPTVKDTTKIKNVVLVKMDTELTKTANVLLNALLLEAEEAEEVMPLS